MQWRQCIAGVGLLLPMACGGDGPTKQPDVVKVQFKVDGQTCTGTATVNFFIDGTMVGAKSLVAGDSSQAFTVTPALHTLGAVVANTASRSWGPFSVDLSQYATFTQLLRC